MYFYSHRVHHLVHSQSFFADHAFLGDLYEGYDSSYDTIIERMIGLGHGVNEFEIIAAANAKFQEFSGDNFENNISYFARILEFEKALVNLIDEVLKGETTTGVANLLQNESDNSENRQYKIGQRVK